MFWISYFSTWEKRRLISKLSHETLFPDFFFASLTSNSSARLRGKLLSDLKKERLQLDCSNPLGNRKSRLGSQINRERTKFVFSQIIALYNLVCVSIFMLVLQDHQSFSRRSQTTILERNWSSNEAIGQVDLNPSKIVQKVLRPRRSAFRRISLNGWIWKRRRPTSRSW